jgi:anthranilate synthase/aminodeoxychorismate synthase-like glutamine amidotransferase
MVLVIDNYDSFTYNLVQYLGELGADVRVRRNDQVTLGEIEVMAPDQILISPGPGRPEDAGITPDVIRRFGPGTPILGVCRRPLSTTVKACSPASTSPSSPADITRS